MDERLGIGEDGIGRRRGERQHHLTPGLLWLAAVLASVVAWTGGPAGAQTRTTTNAAAQQGDGLPPPTLGGGNGVHHFFSVDGYAESLSGCGDQTPDNPNLRTGHANTSTMNGHLWLDAGVLHAAAATGASSPEDGTGVLRHDGSFHLDYPQTGPSTLREIDGTIGAPDPDTDRAPIAGTWTTPYPNGTSACLIHWAVTDGYVDLSHGAFGVRFSPKSPPRPRPTTVKEPSEELCPSHLVSGPFEPTQGVWQDDPTFTDPPNPLLRTVGGATYEAELPLVSRRPTVIAGAVRLAGGPATEAGRSSIRFVLETTGTKPVATRVRLRSIGAGGDLDAVANDLNPPSLPLGAPCDRSHPHREEVVLGAPKGLPTEKTFSFRDSGSYTLVATIETAKGKDTGLESQVKGTVVIVPQYHVTIVPVVLKQASADDKSALASRASDLATKLEQQLPDFWPLMSRKGVHARVSILVDLASAGGDENALKGLPLNPKVQGSPFTKNPDTGSPEPRLGERGSRIVALLRKSDMKAITSVHVEEAGGKALSDFVVALPQNADPAEVAHELSHTLPHSVWSSDEMKSECNLAYHWQDLPGNEKSGEKQHNPANLLAHGYQLLRDGEPVRKLRDREYSWMTGFPGRWVDQCTYRHILTNLARQ